MNYAGTVSQRRWSRLGEAGEEGSLRADQRFGDCSIKVLTASI